MKQKDNILLVVQLLMLLVIYYQQKLFSTKCMNVYQILSLQQADNSNKGTRKSGESEQYVKILDVLEEIRSEDGCFSLKDLAVNGHDLMQIGFTGRSIGVMLNWLLDQVIEETLPNDRDVLLAWAKCVWIAAWRNS